MEECKHATSETSFEAKAYNEIRAGIGSRRIDSFTSGGCIGIGGADARGAADTELYTDAGDHSR